jgi:hypothetical protein
MTSGTPSFSPIDNEIFTQSNFPVTKMVTAITSVTFSMVLKMSGIAFQTSVLPLSYNILPGQGPLYVRY